MNWEAIGAVGEVVGAAGVIASLVYLAVQIRQNTRSVRRTSARQSSEKNALALRALADYSDLFSGNHMGLDRIAELNPSERTRFDMIMGMWMRAKEQDFADVREGDTGTRVRGTLPGLHEGDIRMLRRSAVVDGASRVVQCFLPTRDRRTPQGPVIWLSACHPRGTAAQQATVARRSP